MWQIALIVAAALQWGTPGQGWAPAPRAAKENPAPRCAISDSASSANRYMLEENGLNLGLWQKLSETGSVAKLTRAASAESAVVRQAIQQWQNKDPRNVTITVEGATGSPVSHQTLTGAIPTKWTTESMNAGSSQVTIETLELSFQSIRC